MNGKRKHVEIPANYFDDFEPGESVIVFKANKQMSKDCKANNIFWGFIK